MVTEVVKFRKEAGHPLRKLRFDDDSMRRLTCLTWLRGQVEVEELDAWPSSW